MALRPAVVFFAFASILFAESPRLTIGVGHVPPISYSDHSGHAGGFAVDILNEAARREGIDLIWRPIGSSRDIERALDEGTLDLVPAGMVTRHRRERFFVSEPWWFVELSLLTRSGDELRSPADLRNKRLALASPIYAALVEQRFPPLVQVPLAATADAALKVCEGAADAALMTHTAIHEFMLSRPLPCRDISMSMIDTDATAELAVISRRGVEQFARRLRHRIDEMALDGAIAAVAGHYPSIPTFGIVKLADALRIRYERRTWFLALGSALWLLVVGGLFLLRQRKTQQALRASRERYRLLVECNPVGFIHAAIDGPEFGRYHGVNQAFLDLIGYSREEVESGRVDARLLTPAEWLPADAHAIEELRREGRSRLYEKEYLRKDGTRVPSLVACAAFGKNDVVAFAIDISERRRLEKQVKWLSGLLPICAACKRVRDEDGQWQQLEVYMNSRISADFSHSLCPHCLPAYSK